MTSEEIKALNDRFIERLNLTLAVDATVEYTRSQLRGEPAYDALRQAFLAAFQASPNQNAESP